MIPDCKQIHVLEVITQLITFIAAAGYQVSSPFTDIINALDLIAVLL